MRASCYTVFSFVVQEISASLSFVTFFLRSFPEFRDEKREEEEDERREYTAIALAASRGVTAYAVTRKRREQNGTGTEEERTIAMTKKNLDIKTRHIVLF